MCQQVQRSSRSLTLYLDGVRDARGPGGCGVLRALDGLYVARAHEHIDGNRGGDAQQNLRAQCNAHASHLSRVKTTKRAPALTCVSPTTLRSMLSLSRPAAGM